MIVETRNPNSQQSLLKVVFMIVFILAVLCCLLAIVVIVLIGALGFSGYGDSTPITLTCTNDAYYLYKFSQLTVIYKTTFYFSLLCVAFSITVVSILVFLLFKFMRSAFNTIRGIQKVALYLTSSLMVLASIISAGYFLVYKVQISNCQVYDYNTTHVLAIGILAMILVGLGLIMWALLIYIFTLEVESQEKYKQVITHPTHPTEPNEQKRPEQFYNTRKQELSPVVAKKQQRPSPQPAYILEQTQENLNDQPNKSRIYTYNKETSPVDHYKYDESRNHRPETKPYESRVYKHVDNSPPRQSPEKTHKEDEGLMYHYKKKTPETKKYDQALVVQSKNYLGGHGQRSVLNSSRGIEEREKRSSQYYRSGERKEQRSSPNKPQRQGVLLNYIRGKYAG